ncbi:autotransporter outer membrane beta-barrel domain-containing protein [Bradyrhizobium sp. JYMT SZCCT0180]|uniref:autotransporter outer membrane beta-barrel domain-containing protein n=1 Tax=Bradyrhizobium sp. JYMT SZCCT0180 TaxID=2807666 RepID=UPI001BA9863C|nr:autotransporter outer membrane beta-barrel domain-containing protein [Bradyrhizobium sp. JYMT SZCCT0180]MBR1211977.1 autotransporter domain-containing protein [Bradyrhizobium sp. JYMT SZCCT0180]
MRFLGFVGRPDGPQFADCTTLSPPRRRTTLLAGTAFTGAFVAAIVAYPQGALAACLGESTASVTCDAGNQATAGALTTTFNGTTIVDNNAGGKIDAGGAFANVTAAGSLTFNNNDTTFGITNIAGSGVTLLNNFGAVTYIGNAAVTGAADAITASSAGAGNVTVTSNATALSTSNSGISASKTAGSGDILVNGSGAATGADFGIVVGHSGTSGGITISGSGGATGTAAAGIAASIFTATNASSILIDRSGTVTGASGISASHAGTGNVTVTGGSLVSATAGTGIEAKQLNNLAGTNGSVTVGGSGDVNAVGGFGITAEVSGTNNSGSVTVNRTGNVTATNAAIIASAVGGGNVTVSGVGNVTSTGGFGIFATAIGGNGNVQVAAAGTVSGSVGMLVSASGLGTATATVANNVTGTVTQGVVTSTAAGLNTVNVTAGTIQGAQSGISSASGTGNINVTVGAGVVVVGTASFGVSVAGGTSNTIANNGSITGTIGLIATGGTATVTNTGSITGTGGTAAVLTGANNTFIMSGAAAALNGNALGGGSGTFRLAGNADNSFNVSKILGGWTLLDKTGTSNWTLTGISSYAGAVTVNGGTMSVNGNMSSASTFTVNAGGTLGGSGIVGDTIVNAGGTLAPGNSIGTLSVSGSLTMAAASTYLVEISPVSADRVFVTGVATLGGATVNANFAAGTYVEKKYTILNATGGVNGTFNGPVNTNLPGGFKSSLSYDTNNAYLNLEIGLAQYSGLNANQQNVANAVSNFFNTTGGIPLVFGTLTPAGLTQVSGETAVGSQQSTFNAMNLFMGLITDPFIAGRGDPISGGGNPNAYAEEGSLAYAAKRKPNDALAAIYTKAPPVAPAFAQRWSVWAAGFGGSQTTDGNTVLGSNNTRSSLAAGAVGADYRLSPNTLAGFALAGGGTNFSVNGFGSGRSDLFQAGAFIRHNVGPAYITGALAYGWQDVATDRTVTVAGIDRLRAQFNANAWSGRVEGGYRFVSHGFGWTPYAAGQFTTFELPAYAEQAIVGANTFALAYNAKSVTSTRSELGLRTDKSFAVQDGIFTLRGRAAWAHDYNPDRSIGATFQTLPGASFVVNGARQAADAALVTGSAEMKWINGWSIAGTFEGEFSKVTESYAGKGVVRYAW